jgi:hypothetical protein
MECPEGLVREGDEVLLLLKSLYGLVQSARQFFKKFVAVLKSIGFVQSVAEPCLLIRRSSKGIVMLVIHVDDCFTVGNIEAIQETIKLIEEKGFELKVEEVTDYLGCEILINKQRTKAWLGQPTMIKKIETTFGKLIKSSCVYKTPGTPSYNIIRPTNENEQIGEEDQQIFRSGVGSLLYLVKHSRPDISNVVRELAKCMGAATPAAFKELKRVIKFVLDTKDYGLRIEPTTKAKTDDWELVLYSDSDWAGDKENRHSVTGYIMFLLGVPILWKSKLQRTVALSSSEAEYYALSEASKEVKFVIQVLESIGIKVELPIIVYVDNVGAIFMSENVTATSRTRHVDARYHFVREFVEDGYIKIIFVRSENNKSDGFTKNVTNDIYEKHKDSYIAERNYMSEPH